MTTIPATTRRAFLATATAAAALGLPGAARAQAARWNLADAYPQTEFMNVVLTAFLDDIKTRTGGAVQITPHFAASLYKNPEIKQATQTGLVQMGTQLMTNLGPENKLWEIDGIPFLVQSYDEAEKLWAISRPHLEDLLAKQGLRLLYAAPWPSQGFFFKKEVNSLKDAAGLRQRAYNASTSRLAQLMGTIPTTVQITEAPQAFATGMIQALNTSPTTGVLFKMWEFTTHFYDTNAWLPKQMVFVNEAAFKGLPAAQQQAILDAAKAAEPKGWAASREQVDVARKELAAKGMKVVAPSPELKAEFTKIGETMTAEWLAGADDTAKKVVAEFKKAVGRAA